MNPLDVVVPFNVFTAYRERRSRGGLAGESTAGTPGAGAAFPARESSDCVDAPAVLMPASLPAPADAAERAPALAKPAIERIPS